MPILDYTSYDNTGAPFKASAIVTDSLFDLEKYKAYSPIFLPAALVVGYGVTFASLTAMAVHTFCKSALFSDTTIFISIKF
jgi:hypothetical protein